MKERRERKHEEESEATIQGEGGEKDFIEQCLMGSRMRNKPKTVC